MKAHAPGHMQKYPQDKVTYLEACRRAAPGKPTGSDAAATASAVSAAPTAAAERLESEAAAALLCCCLCLCPHCPLYQALLPAVAVASAGVCSSVAVHAVVARLALAASVADIRKQK